MIERSFSCSSVRWAPALGKRAYPGDKLEEAARAHQWTVDLRAGDA
jgi:hypothetical protein